MPTIDDDLARRLPLPLAQLYRRAHNAREPLERHQAAYYLWEAALKLLGAVAIVGYADRSRHDPRLAERLRNLARPSTGHWWEFVRLLVPVLADAEAGGFAEVKERLLGPALDDAPAVAGLDEGLRSALGQGGGPRGKVRLQDLFDRLVAYRNRVIGHAAVGLHGRDFYDRMGPALLAGVGEALARLDVLAGAQLVHVTEVRRQKSGKWLVECDSLTGETASRLDPRELPGVAAADLPRPECLYLELPAEAGNPAALRSLHPLLVYDPPANEVFFLNAQRNRERAEYLCYASGRVVDREELAGEQQALLARVLGAPVDPEQASRWAAEAHAEEEKEALTESGPAPRPTPARIAASETPRVVLLYKRRAQPDEELLHWLEKEFVARGYQVFIDRHLAVGVEWARELERQVREADAVVALLSAASVQSEMLACEVQIAHDEAQRRGRPLLLPVRVQFDGALPHELSAVLDRLQYFPWTGHADDPRLLGELLGALRQPAPLQAVSPPVGVVPLDTRFYIVRPTDEEFQAALARRDSVILIRGARQMGKTSLLARGLHQARGAGARVVLTDFQKLNASDLVSAEALYRTLGEWIADELDLEVFPGDVWNARRGPSVNFERYLRREVLDKLTQPLVWAMDEVDRLFACPFGSEVFGLFRSWHNARVLDPSSPWSRLTLAIAYATEAHLFITDMNQSPFNIGTLLALEDFTFDQVAELNRRYGGPLRSEADVRQYHELVGGHPYLANRGLYELVHQGLDLAAFRAAAERDDGVFGDHLRRILVLLARDPALCDVVRGVLRGRPCPSPESFYRLRSAGVLGGDSARDAQPRCRLYARYLERHLL